MAGRLVSVTMTEEQARLIYGLLSLAGELGRGDLSGVWSYFPLRLEYSSVDPRDVVKRVKDNFDAIDKISRQARFMLGVTPPATYEKTQRIKDVSDIHTAFTSAFFPDSEYLHSAPPAGQYPYVKVNIQG